MIDTEATLRSVAEGNRKAFSALYRCWQPLLVRYATGLLGGDRAAAEDVVDEALLAVWQQAGRYAATGSATGWLRRIVRNKSIDWLRRQRESLLPADAMAALTDKLASPAQSASDMAEQHSERAALVRAMAVLSIEHREAIWLCYFEELSIQEIAEIADCPANTVKTRLFYARRILRESKLLGLSQELSV